MTELAAGDGQAVADLTQALSLGQLAKEHSDTLIPGREALGVAFRPTFIDQPQKEFRGRTWRIWLNRLVVNFMVETPS